MFITIESASAPTDALIPFEVHRSSGYYQVTTPSMQLRCKARQAYPATYCRTLADGSIAAGYGPQQPTSEDEYLRIIMRANGALSIQRDCFATLPLYYAQHKNGFIISDQYDKVLERTGTLTLDRQAMLTAVLPTKNYYGTLWHGIHVLQERELLTLQNNRLSVCQAPSRSWETSWQATPTNPYDFHARLEQQFDYFYQTRLQQARFAFELSGGLDSATLPLYLRQAHPGLPLRTTALIHPGDTGRGQQVKLAALQDALHADRQDLTLQSTRHAPLARYIHRGRYQHFNPYSMMYYEANEDLARMLQAAGTDVVVTGIGGDDIMENIVTASQHHSVESADIAALAARTPPYITPDFMQAWQAALQARPPASIPLIPASIHMIAIARYGIYIDHDIWPVSPFASPGLYAFCQGLPAHMRANKNILRAYHQAKQFPAEIYAAQHNENFEPFLREAFASGIYQDAITFFAERSTLAAEGLIDKQQLYALRDQLGNTDIDTQWLFYLYAWLSVEMNIPAAT